MAKRSRLGKGLGALFPELPGEEPKDNTQDKGSQAPTQSQPQTKSSNSDNKAEHNSPKSNDATRSESHMKATQPEDTTAKKTAGDTVAVESKQTANKAKKTKSSRPNRMTVPIINELERPSDLFFGGADQDVSRETDESQPRQKAAAGSSTEGARAQNAHASGVNESGDEGLKPVKGGYLAELDVNSIRANSEQPRRIFDEDELVELSNSIAEVGLLQPIVVRKIQNKQDQETSIHYEIIMGERRWRATKMAGKQTLPAIIRTTSDTDMLRDALLENLHRVALNPLEEAAAYQQMMEEFNMTQEELSKSVSKSRPQIANMLRLLKLPPLVQKKLESGVLSAGHARALLALSSSEDMESLADKIISEGLSVRSTEELVALKTNAVTKKPRKQKTSIWAGSPLLGNLENHFETKVDIKGSEKRGKIEITYSSQDDMNRILSLLLQKDNTGTVDSSNNDGWV